MLMEYGKIIFGKIYEKEIIKKYIFLYVIMTQILFLASLFSEKQVKLSTFDTKFEQF
jgi:hypothetical protein